MQAQTLDLVLVLELALALALALELEQVLVRVPMLVRTRLVVTYSNSATCRSSPRRSKLQADLAQQACLMTSDKEKLSHRFWTLSFGFGAGRSTFGTE